MWLFLCVQQNLNHMGCSDAIHGWMTGRMDGWMDDGTDRWMESFISSRRPLIYKMFKFMITFASCVEMGKTDGWNAILGMPNRTQLWAHPTPLYFKNARTIELSLAIQINKKHKYISSLM